MKTKYWVLLLSLGVTSGTLALSLSMGHHTQAQLSSPMSNHRQDHQSQPGDREDHFGLGHPSMSLGPADQQFDLRFIDAMIPHHQGAVVMAKEALQGSQRPEIQQLAEDIIAAQEKEIQQMQAWRRAWYPEVSAEPQMWNEGDGHMMAMSAEQISAMMMSIDPGDSDNQFDLRFINAMIPHHEAALVMAEAALSNSQREEIRELAAAILASQQAEIQQMTRWREEWYPR